MQSEGAGDMWQSVGDICDQKETHDTQTALSVLLPPSQNSSFSLSSFMASALATATSSLELGWSFLCRSNRTLTLPPAFETANPPGTSSQDTALPPNPAPAPQPWSLLSSYCVPPGASQCLVTCSSVGSYFQPLITTHGLRQLPLHPSLASPGGHLLVVIRMKKEQGEDN